MKTRAAILLILPALALSAGGRHRRGGPLVDMKQAKAIAARDTGGTAVSAKEIPLNAASGGWEVDVHMPNEHQGWRCVIDDDTHMVRTKTRIPNPDLPTRGRKRK
ncbi:MAG: PepSY domain-containing protein [Acidobacteria bacterium]|nr:PepSY domain-containing protein [Acidobacteriota bacterium]